MIRQNMAQFLYRVIINSIPRMMIALVVFYGMLNLCQAQNENPLPEGIELRILLPKESICLGSKSLPMEVYITNVASEEITISNVWKIQTSYFDVAYDQGVGNSRIAELYARGDPFPGASISHSWFKLSPGASKRFKTSIKLRDDPNFFTGPAFYRFTIQCIFFSLEVSGEIREVASDSNKVLFELTSCPTQSEE